MHYIKVKDRKLLDAMQNVGPEQMDIVTRFVSGITRFLSSVNTAYDPTFVVTNFTRPTFKQRSSILPESRLKRLA